MAHLRAGNSQQSTLKGEGYYRCPTGFISHSLRDTFEHVPMLLGHVGSCCWVWDTFKRPFKMRFWDRWGSMPALKAARELDWRISRTVGESWCLALDSSVSMTPFFALSLWQKKTESNLPCWKIPHCFRCFDVFCFFPAINHYKPHLWMISIIWGHKLRVCFWYQLSNLSSCWGDMLQFWQCVAMAGWSLEKSVVRCATVLCQVASGDLT